MRNIIFAILLFCLYPFNVKAQNGNSSDSIYTIYEFYQEILDRGDTVKRKAQSFGGCGELLTQIIKKNDSVLIINEISIPCIKNGTKYTKNSLMPPYEHFDNVPYSIELPIDAYNYWNCNIINVTGKITIINKRRNYETRKLIQYTPYSNYNMNFFDFLTFADTTNEEYGLYDYLYENYVRNSSYEKIDLFSERFRNSFGMNATFSMLNIWGVHITEHFIVLIENVPLYETEDEDEEKYIKIFIKIAKSIQPIDPNVFDLKDLDNYTYDGFPPKK